MVLLTAPTSNRRVCICKQVDADDDVAVCASTKWSLKFEDEVMSETSVQQVS